MLYSLLVLLIIMDCGVISQNTKDAANPCSCQRYGNFYSPVIEDDCQTFTQRGSHGGDPIVMACPAGLQFDLERCVCTRNVVCYCEMPVCEEVLLEEYDKLVNMTLEDKCEEAQERLADILKVCVVKNAADRAAVSQLFVSTLDRLGVCPELGGPTKECNQLSECIRLTTGQGESINGTDTDSVDNTKFLCENVEEAEKCFQCSLHSGCKLATSYIVNLRNASQTLCQKKTFTSCSVLDSRK